MPPEKKPAMQPPPTQTAVEADGAAGASAAPPKGEAPGVLHPTSQDDYVTVIVTPKLTFQLCRRPEWKVVQDITQEELRRGFLSRFPPALWMSSHKYSFKAALPPTARISEETTSLVFKIVSEEVSDDRVMLSILRELEKSYEAIIRRAVTETRSEALQEQITLQEQAEEARREQEKMVQALRKENKSIREQLQSIQKRLFLVEQEKDVLRKEQTQTKEQFARLERQSIVQVQESRVEHDDLRLELETLRLLVEGAIDRGGFCVHGQSSERAVEAPLATPPEVEVVLPPQAGSAAAISEAVLGLAELAAEPERPARPPHSVGRISWADIPSTSSGGSTAEGPCSPRSPREERSSSAEVVAKVDAASQTELPSVEDMDCLARKVDALQTQFGTLQGWLLQGSHLLAASTMLAPLAKTAG